MVASLDIACRLATSKLLPAESDLPITLNPILRVPLPCSTGMVSKMMVAFGRLTLSRENTVRLVLLRFLTGITPVIVSFNITLNLGMLPSFTCTPRMSNASCSFDCFKPGYEAPTM